uniref:Secreted protein n=1 Tax=Anopheles coluzzii TaxID=1518534 RepID=A0A6E8VAN4_ANOCL
MGERDTMGRHNGRFMCGFVWCVIINFARSVEWRDICRGRSHRENIMTAHRRDPPLQNKSEEMITIPSRELPVRHKQVSARRKSAHTSSVRVQGNSKQFLLIQHLQDTHAHPFAHTLACQPRKAFSR